MSSPQIFQINSERCLTPCLIDDVYSSQSEVVNSKPCWIDIDSRNPDSLQPFFESMGVHPLAIEACLDPTPASLLSVYGNSLFIAIPTYKTWDSKTRIFLWIICLPGVIITIHETAIMALQQIVERYSGEGMRFHSNNTSSILYQILDHVIDEDMSFTLKTRDALTQLEESLNEDSGIKLTKETIHLKRQLTRLAAAFEDQLYCVSSLQTIDSDAFSVEDLHDYFRDAFLHLEHASRMVGRQLNHSSAIEQQYHFNQQNKANNRLRLLTVISAIFLPLTLITGIYGMNFRYMPELTWPFAYAGVLSLMFFIAASMLWQFYRRGWFD